jgi:transposase-like protein
MRGTREQQDKWCAEMRSRGYSVWAIAQRLGVSENRVLRAVERVRAGRYDG